MGHHRIQPAVQPQTGGRGTLSYAGKAVRPPAVESMAEQQRSLPSVQAAGNADASVRQAHPLFRKECRFLRFELLLPQGITQTNRIREPDGSTRRDEPDAGGFREIKVVVT